MKTCTVEIRRACSDSGAPSPDTGYCVFNADQGFVPDDQGHLLHTSRTAALKAAFASVANPQKLFVLFNPQPNLTLKAA